MRCAAIWPNSWYFQLATAPPYFWDVTMSWWSLCSGSVASRVLNELIWCLWLKCFDFFFWLSLDNLLQDELREEDIHSSVWTDICQFPRCKTHPHHWKSKPVQHMGMGTLIQVGFCIVIFLKIWFLDHHFLEILQNNGDTFLELIYHQFLAFAILSKPYVYGYRSFQVMKILSQY